LVHGGARRPRPAGPARVEATPCPEPRRERAPPGGYGGREQPMRHLRVPVVVVILGLVLAACGAQGPGGDAIDEIGEGEGELNLIIWAGYAERGEVDPGFDWVTPFEEETGCQVNTTNMTD